MPKKSELTIAKTLVKLTKKKFGDRRGRYRILRSHFLALAGRKTLDDATLRKIQAITQERGYILVDLGDAFAVLEEEPMKKTYRQVTKKIFTKLMEKLHLEKEKERFPAKAKKKKDREED